MLNNAFSQALSMLLPVPLPKPMERGLAAAIGLQRLEKLYEELVTSNDQCGLASRLLKKLEVRYRVSDKDRAQFPRTGPTIVIANHPFGVLDGAILSDLLLSIRSDVKFLANAILDNVPEIRDLLIGVDAITRAPASLRNLRSVRHAYRHLAGGGLLVVFPAGEVSHFQWRRGSIEDSVWNNVAAKLVSSLSRNGCEATIVPVHVNGSNSLLFQSAGVVHSRLRTLLLVRELMNKCGCEVEVRAGTPISPARLMALRSEDERTSYLRWRTYLLAHRHQYKTRTELPIRKKDRFTEPQPIAPASPENALTAEIEALEPLNLLASAGEMQVFVASACQIPAILAEIGRLRELAFRAVGEGTGKPSDIDLFDAHYEHLFVWNAGKREVVGAYRLAGTDIARSRFGVRGLYTATLFNYGDKFLDEIDPALELGRSFIRLEYQRTFAPLLLLWRGIGRYLAQHLRYKILFGPVSISNSYQSVSRELMVAWLERRASIEQWRHLVSSRHPFRSKSGLPEHWLSEIEELSVVVEDIEPDQRGVPILLRQYLKLGGKLLAFNIDPEFSYALDGLIVVDLTRTDRKLLDRYLGQVESELFLKFHNLHVYDKGGRRTNFRRHSAGL